MASRLVDSLHAAFDATAHHDEYRERVLDLIARKAKGETIETPEPEEPERQDDLLAALEASLDRHGGRQRSGNRRSGSGSGTRSRKRSRSTH
jgi:DNA end-binding protein Ku